MTKRFCFLHSAVLREHLTNLTQPVVGVWNRDKLKHRRMGALTTQPGAALQVEHQRVTNALQKPPSTRRALPYSLRVTIFRTWQSQVIA